MELENKQKKDIMEAIKNNRLYDFIASNYWRLDNNIIIELLKECIYTLDLDNTKTQKQLIDNLQEFEGWED